MDLTNKTDEIKARKLHDYFLSKLPELIKEHPWEWVVFGEDESMEFYADFPIASQEGFKKYGPKGIYIIQQVEVFPPTNIVFNVR